MPSKLEQLKKYTTVVADTGDIQSIEKYSPQDVTTNPSLLLQSAQEKHYQHLVEDAVAWGKSQEKKGAEQMKEITDRLAINFGKELLKKVPGKVSTEIDPRDSFHTENTKARARKIIKMYEAEGIPKERVLIKIASTWEGIQAARELQQEGILCNLTLMFNLGQAIAAAEAGVYLISPFVGRILDWYKNSTGQEYSPEQDPGVKFVSSVYEYYKKFGYSTIVMGASFRSQGEIEQLAGCDYLTNAPKLLDSLSQDSGELTMQLQAEKATQASVEKIEMNESTFRWMMNEDAMATEKLADGIRRFAVDLQKLEEFIRASF